MDSKSKISVNLKREILSEIFKIIEPVGRKTMSVDTGFGLMVEKLFGTTSYVSLSYSEKIEYLSRLSAITVEVEIRGFLTSREIDYFYNAVLNVNFSNN